MEAYIPENWRSMERTSEGVIPAKTWFASNPSYKLKDYAAWSSHYLTMTKNGKTGMQQTVPLMEADLDAEFYQAEYMLFSAVKLAMSRGKKSMTVLCQISGANKEKLEPIMEYLGVKYTLSPLLMRTHVLKLEWDFVLSERTTEEIERINQGATECPQAESQKSDSVPTNLLQIHRNAMTFVL